MPMFNCQLILFLPNQEKMDEVKRTEEHKKTTPHFWNLNEDPALTGMVFHFCDKGIHKYFIILTNYILVKLLRNLISQNPQLFCFP